MANVEELQCTYGNGTGADAAPVRGLLLLRRLGLSFQGSTLQLVKHCAFPARSDASFAITAARSEPAFTRKRSTAVCCAV